MVLIFHSEIVLDSFSDILEHAATEYLDTLKYVCISIKGKTILVDKSGCVMSLHHGYHTVTVLQHSLFHLVPGLFSLPLGALSRGANTHKQQHSNKGIKGK